MVIPPTNHPGWKQVLMSDKKPDFEFFAVKMMAQRLCRKISMEPSPMRS